MYPPTLMLSFILLSSVLVAAAADTGDTTVVLVKFGVVGKALWRTAENQSRAVLCHTGDRSVSCFRETVAANCQGLAAIPVNNNNDPNLDSAQWSVKEARVAVGCQGTISAFANVKAFSTSPVRGSHTFFAGLPTLFFSTTLCDIPPLQADQAAATGAKSIWSAIVRPPAQCLGTVCTGEHCMGSDGLLQVMAQRGACLTFGWTVTCGEDTTVDYENHDAWDATLQAVVWAQPHDARKVRVETAYADSESAYM